MFIGLRNFHGLAICQSVAQARRDARFKLLTYHIRMPPLETPFDCEMDTSIGEMCG